MALDPLTLGGIIEGGLQLVGGLFNGYSQQSAVKEANKGNMELAKYQNDRNLELWNMNNAYNDPSAQMDRLKNAGLNPNLVYGNGSVVGNTSSPPPSTNVPTLQPAAYQLDSQSWSGLSQLADIALKEANINKTNEEAKNLSYQRVGLEKDNKLKDLDIILKGYSNAKSKVEADNWADLFEAKLSLLEAEGVLKHASAMNIDSQRFFRDSYGKSQAEQSIAESKSRVDLNKSNIARNSSEIALNVYRANVMSAQIEQLLSSAGVNRQQSLKIANEIINLESDNRLKFSTLTAKEQENLLRQVLIDQGIDLRDGNLFRAFVRGISNAQFHLNNGDVDY